MPLCCLRAIFSSNSLYDHDKMVSDVAIVTSSLGSAGILSLGVYCGLATLGQSIKEGTEKSATELPRALKQRFSGVQFLDAEHLSALLPLCAPPPPPPPPGGSLHLRPAMSTSYTKLVLTCLRSCAEIGNLKADACVRPVMDLACLEGAHTATTQTWCFCMRHRTCIPAVQSFRS